MAKEKDIVTKLGEVLIGLTKEGRLDWRVGRMNQKTGDFRAKHKDFSINLEGVYSVPSENYFRFRLLPLRLLEGFDKQIGFRTYRVSEVDHPEAYLVLSELVEQIRAQLDDQLLEEVRGGGNVKAERGWSLMRRLKGLWEGGGNKKLAW